MGRLIFAVSVVWLMLLGNEVRHSDLTFWQAAASLARSEERRVGKECRL